MAEDTEFGEFEKDKPAEQVKQTTEEVKSTVKEDKGKSVRDRARDFKQQAVESVGKAQEKLAPVFSAAKDKLETIEEKRPEVQQGTKDMLNQAKHTVGRVVQQESKDVVEGMKRLAQDEKAFQDAAHKVAEKVTGKQHEDSSHRQQEQRQPQQHIPDFSDFSEMEDEFSDEGEGSSHHPKQRLLQGHDEQQRPRPDQHPNPKHKHKKGPLSYFKVGAKYAGKGKSNEGPDDKKQEERQQGEQQGQDGNDSNHGVLGTVRSVFGQGNRGQNEFDTASNLAQRKLGQMRHIVDAQMDEGGNATAAEKKTQGVGLVQSFVCLCTCASSVHVSG